MCSCTSSFESILGSISLVFSSAIFFMFYFRYFYILVTQKGTMMTLLDALSRVFDRRNLRLILHVPIFFYTPAIFSTTVICVFSYMIRDCEAIHIPTFYVSSVCLIFLTAYIRYITLLAIETDNYSCASKKWLTWLRALSLWPVILDTSIYRKSLDILPCSDHHKLIVSYVLILSIFVLCFFINRYVKFFGLVTLFLFFFMVINFLSALDADILIGISKLSSNSASFQGIFYALLYSNLFAIYTSDLFCPCVEYTLINYANNNAHLVKIDNSKKHFYILTSLIVAAICFVWLVLFINFYNTDFLLRNPSIGNTIRIFTSIVFVLTATMQMYYLVDFIKQQKNKLYYLLILVVLACNFIWFRQISYFTVIIYLTSQLLTALVILKLMNKIDRTL